MKAVTCSFSAFLDLKQASALVPTPGKQLEETEKEQRDLLHSRQVQRKGERRKDLSCLSKDVKVLCYRERGRGCGVHQPKTGCGKEEDLKTLSTLTLSTMRKMPTLKGSNVSIEER